MEFYGYFAGVAADVTFTCEANIEDDYKETERNHRCTEEGAKPLLETF